MTHLAAHQIRILVEHPPEDEPPPLEIDVIAQRAPQVPRADDDELMLSVQPQDLPDFIVEILHIVAVALLAEASEIVEILPNLGSRHLHQRA